MAYFSFFGGLGEAPKDFEVRDLNLSSSEVKPGNPVEASVEVSNVSGSSGKYTVDLMIDGVVENSRTVTISPGETTTVPFSIQKKRKKTYAVEVEDLTENFKVVTPTEFEVNAAEVKDNALKSMENVNTVEAEMERTFGIIMRGNLNETTTRVLATIDRENQRMMETIISGTNEKREYKRYLIENTIYSNMGSILPENTIPSLENFPEWLKFEAKSWKFRSWFAMQKELLERGGVKRLKDEKVNGENSRVLKIGATETYWEYMKNIMEQGSSIFFGMGLPTSSSPAGENVLEAVENMSMEGWYSKESGIPLKVQLQMQISMNDLAQGETTSPGGMRIELLMKFDSFNEPLSIELPEVAENAVPLTALENNSII